MAGRAQTMGRAMPPSAAEENWVARLALRFTDFTERWMPDAFIFALLAALVGQANFGAFLSSHRVTLCLARCQFGCTSSYEAATQRKGG